MAGLVLACSDGRLHESLFALQTRLGIEHADLLLVPGGPVALSRSDHERRSLLEWLAMLVPTHGIDALVLAAHEECLAYAAARRVGGDLDERAAALRDLGAAAELLTARFPGVAVWCFLIPYDAAAARFGSAERVS